MSPTELDPKKYHIISDKQKMLAIILALIFLLIGGPIISYGYYNFAVNRPSQTIDEKTIEIKRGETISDIANRLYREGVINSEFLFKVYIVTHKLQNEVQAGLYVVPGGTTLKELVATLQHGTNDRTITFLEGWRIEEFAKEASLIFSKIDYDEFVIEARSFEGSLFPDTYTFGIEITEKEMINELNETYKLKTENIITQENLSEVNMTEKEVLTLASIVEREVKTDEDRKIVAGILAKRWQEGALLGADATTQYVAAKIRYGCDLDSDDICPKAEVMEVTWWPNDLTQTELDLESPYNTRKLPGLPPAPICNPSLSSIKAVLEMEHTNYYFYINDSEGTTHFAETLEEHNANIAKYL
jgi:UPF0755 protein